MPAPSSLASQRPVLGEEFADFYAAYVARVPDGSVMDTLRRQADATARAFGELTDAQSRHRYLPGAWSIKEMLGHMIDTERVMAYRALSIARGDATPLPGFDQDPWVAAASFDDRLLPELVAEAGVVRAATLALLAPLDERVLGRRGTVSGFPVSVRGLAWIIAGHELHHLEQLRTRYLPGLR
jgi:hypothetical protein